MDSPALRQVFLHTLPPKAIANARANLLGNSVLNTAHFTQICLSGTAVAASGKHEPKIPLDAMLELIGRRIYLHWPALTQLQGRLLRTRSAFTLSQRQLGLQSFTTAMGALRVAENIDFGCDTRAMHAN